MAEKLKTRAPAVVTLCCIVALLTAGMTYAFRALVARNREHIEQNHARIDEIQRAVSDLQNRVNELERRQVVTSDGFKTEVHR